MSKTVESQFMDEPGGAQRFQQLSADAQARYIEISQQWANLARDHAVPIIFAPPLGIAGKINGRPAVRCDSTPAHSLSPPLTFWLDMKNAFGQARC
jgi:hypothetical protein